MKIKTLNLRPLGSPRTNFTKLPHKLSHSYIKFKID